MNWLDWSSGDAGLSGFVAQLAGLRRDWPQLRLRDWLDGRSDDDGRADVQWSAPDGLALAPGDWDDPAGAGLTMRLAHPDDGPGLLLLLSRADGPLEFRLPDGNWQVLLDSAARDGPTAAEEHQAGAHGRVTVHGPAVVLLAAVSAPDHPHEGFGN